jgi:site-specific DNA-methyltransferase (adenine-specific)
MNVSAPLTLRRGDCLELLAQLPDACADAFITDPPYAEVDRPYGRLTEAEWWRLMMGVCAEARRILKPTGSAVFILQPNSRRNGSLRGWLYRFQAWACAEWNVVQDAYWWNFAALPVGGANRHGLMRGSVKPVVWCGPHDCYRNQSAVLWEESQRNAALRASARAGREQHPSGHQTDRSRATGAAALRGGVSPFNLLPIAPDGVGGDYGHGAATPLALADWWTRYLVPPGGLCVDPFTGSGTMALAAIKHRRRFVGFERDPGYYRTAKTRTREALEERASA